MSVEVRNFLYSCLGVEGERRTLDLGLDIVDGVRRLHLKGDGLTREGLDEDLHLEGLAIALASCIKTIKTLHHHLSSPPLDDSPA